jgi:hypothetical protein
MREQRLIRATMGLRAAVLALALTAPLACGGGSGGTGSGGASGSASGGASGTATGGASGAGTGGTTSGGSGGTTGSTTSGVQGSKRLDALTADEKKKLCDFQAQHFGGYGKSIDCGGGNTLDADASQAECVSQWPTSCAMTVSQAEACSRDATCDDFIPASCAPLFDCS